MELLTDGGASNGGLIIISAVVVLGLIGTVILTSYMISHNRHKRIIEANKRHEKMSEL
jgi:hypothetical protein